MGQWLKDIAPKMRRKRILAAITEVLNTADAPMGTAKLVKAIRAKMDALDDDFYIAKELQRATAGGHPQRQPTGETFRKYGREMPRYEWLPITHEAPPPPKRGPGRPRKAKAEDTARRDAIKALEETPNAEEEWAWTPPVDDNGFLED